jgi:hypothetical protein
MSISKVREDVRRLEFYRNQADWNAILNKPGTFPPAAHGHSQGEVTGLVSDLAGKQATLVSGTNIRTINGTSLLGSGNIAVSGGGAADSFETVAKNLSASDATLAYSGGDLVSVTYASGVTKTLAYSGGNLVTVTLSGSTPGGIDLVKTLTYTGSDLTGVAYS